MPFPERMGPGNRPARWLKAQQTPGQLRDPARGPGRRGGPRGRIRAVRYIDPRAGKIALAQWRAKWFPAQDFADNTVRAYSQAWRKHIAPRWGPRSTTPER